MSRRSTQNSQTAREKPFSLRVLRFLRLTFVGVIALGAVVTAHDFERTQIALTFARDGSFVLDVTNDAAWLTHRLIPFAAGGSPSFIDRVVLFVDGREVRPDSVEYIRGPEPVGTYRMRGRLPIGARTLRWYYGLPIDPYPLTIRRADGRVVAEEIAGDAWSRSIDLAGQFNAPLLNEKVAAMLLAVLLIVPVTLRVANRRRGKLLRAFVPSWLKSSLSSRLR